MNYKSFFDLSNDLMSSVHKLPLDIDLVVGVPRSGLMAASMLALNLNIRLCDLYSFLRNDPIKTGNTRKAIGKEINRAQEARKVLIIDDSIISGQSIAQVKSEIEKSGYNGIVYYMAVYATKETLNQVDIYSEIVPSPRVFQWNLFHRESLALCCLDIDGVLCEDPTTEQNDDGDKYREFILNAKLIAKPSYKIGHLVTSRLEKYRSETEEWLRVNGIKYEELHMLNVTSAEERRRLGAHAPFKAKIYSSLPNTILFVESETHQAQHISKLSGKPVLDFSKHKIVYPKIGIPLIRAESTNFIIRAKRKLSKIIKL